MNVLLLSKYGRLGASSRLRSYQYLPFLESRDIHVSIAPLLSDEYVSGLYWGKTSMPTICAAYLKRLLGMFRARRFDVIWVEKELLPWLPAWLERSLLPANVPLMVDYDDAIFHRYDQHRFGLVRKLMGRKIDVIMKRANLVIAGNDYLADRARKAGAGRIEYLPTVIDIARYEIVPAGNRVPVTIGWIGTPWSMRYLSLIGPVIVDICKSGSARFVAVGANAEAIGSLPIEVRPWSEDLEVSEIRQFDVGIMPLPNESFEHGKCGYKLIQYMACGLPVVASPIGVNTTIVRDGIEGFHANEIAHWHEALQRLCIDTDLRRRMGVAGRARVEAEFTLQLAGPRLEALLRSASE